MSYFINKLYELIKVFYPTKSSKKFIEFNKKIWIKKNDNYYNKGEILLDLFHHYPFVNIWSYIVNIIKDKKKLKVRYFYFYFYLGLLNQSKFYSFKLKKIYESFNVKEGIDERNNNFNKSNKRIEKIFQSLSSKKKLLNFTYKNIKIGDLLYDTYLRTKLEPTVDINDIHLKNLTIRAINIFDHISNYLKKNNVKLIIVSHPYYIQYGIITRIACKNKIPVLMIYSKSRGHDIFRLKLIDRKHPVEDFKYYNYKKKFLSLKSKKNRLNIGKRLIKDRFSKKFLDQLPYMKKNIYINRKKFQINQKKSNDVYIFAHDFFDNPHRFRWMIFEDFLEQIKFLEKIAAKTPNLNWFLKPHPNAIDKNYEIFYKIFANFKYIKLVDKDLNNFEIINKKPKFVITNHGTVAHEFAYHKIPVINTGDNLHINYNFCLHAKNKKNLEKIIIHFEKFKKKINFDKKNIYEFTYMDYFYSRNQYNEFKLDKMKIWSSHSDYDDCLDYYTKQPKKNINLLKNYINNFLAKNLD